VEAYGPADTSTAAGAIQWLISDHLGTPRMIFDASGDLDKTTRHDYLPFGEELFAPTGRRSTALGYTGDSIRQQFTLKERDVETGLDYFGARYYSSMQGRFTGTDPGPFTPADPQNFNRYSYVQNNPLKFVDPTGKTLTLTGTDADDLVEELEKKTGYKLVRDQNTGRVTIDKNVKRNKQGTSKDLAGLLKKVVSDKKTDVAIDVDQNQTGVFYDSFASRQFDMADHKALDASYPEFAADSIGHVLKEYYTANKKYAGQHDSVAFPPSHDKALKFESKVLSNYTGRKEQKSQEAAPAPNTIRFIYTTVHYDIVLKSGVPGGPKDTVQSVSRQNNTSPGVP
jgi:RHS repeat-associated protein